MLNFIKNRYKEILFQASLHIIVFLFFAFDKRNPKFDLAHLVYFINHSISAFIISYWALPRYYKNLSILKFLFFIGISIFGAVLIEELFLEHIFHPGFRADNVRIFYCFIEMTPVIGILSGVKFAWDAFTKQKEIENLKSSVKESELAYLRSQFNPHFLFNNLNNLYSYALTESERTPEIILEFSGILRYMLYECKDPYVDITKEIIQLNNYINLNRLQLEDRGVVTTSFSDNLHSFKIAPLVVIAFVENAFKHSIASQTKDIMIHISATRTENNYFVFVCENSYQKITNNTNVSKGIGLMNVKKRLKLIYPNKHQLEIKNENNIFRVHLSIDLNVTNR